MHNDYGDDDGYDGDYDDVRAKAEARVQKREAVRRNLRRFFVVDGLLWTPLVIAQLAHINASVVHTLMFMLLCASIPVGLYFAARWYVVTRLDPAREQRYHEELKREMEIELERRNLTEKRKRLALADDGELVDYVDEDDLPAKRSRTR